MGFWSRKPAQAKRPPRPHRVMWVAKNGGCHTYGNVDINSANDLSNPVEYEELVNVVKDHLIEKHGRTGIYLERQHIRITSITLLE